MWTRGRLREKAELNLKDCYFNAMGTVFLAEFIIALFLIIFMAIYTNIIMKNVSGMLWWTSPSAIVWWVIRMVFWLFFIVLVFQICIMNPLKVGIARYFLQNQKKAQRTSDLFFAFQEGRYLGIVGTMFMRDVLIALWSLLLVVPGIMKTYEYFMVPYIIAEDSSIGYSKAFEKSRKVMDGHKFDTCMLLLSFTGWVLLALCIATTMSYLASGVFIFIAIANESVFLLFISSVIASSVALMFVSPVEAYREATKAELYQAVAKKTNARDDETSGRPPLIDASKQGGIKGVSGIYAGAEISIKPDEEIIIGRDASICGLVIQSTKVSRKHCGIIFDGKMNHYRVIDYSTHGTYLNDNEKLQAKTYQKVERGSLIRLNNQESFRLL